MEDKKDLLNPEDFEDTDEVETEDGNEEETEEVEDESTSEEDVENAKTQDTEDEDKEGEKPKRNFKKDASFAEKRREKERIEREQREAKIREDAKLEGKLSVIKTNPYTDEEIKDADDLEMYEIQKELDEEGLDPVADLPKRLIEIKREKRLSQEKANKEKEELDTKLKQDIEDFRKAYPDVKTSDLANDENYMEFANDKIGRWTTKEIYEAYVEKNNSAKEKKAMTEKEIDDIAKKTTKNPTSNQSGKTPTKTVEEMSPEEFKAYWRKKYGD